MLMRSYLTPKRLKDNMKIIYQFIKGLFLLFTPRPSPVSCAYRGVSVAPEDICKPPNSEYRKEWLRRFPNAYCESCGLRKHLFYLHR